MLDGLHGVGIEDDEVRRQPWLHEPAVVDAEGRRSDYTGRKGRTFQLSHIVAIGETLVPLVKVKEKYQVTLPASVRQKAGVAVGDILEAVAEGNKITLRPKSVIDRELALALEDVRKGRVVGPFNSAAELLADLHKRVARRAKRTKRAKTA